MQLRRGFRSGANKRREITSAPLRSAPRRAASNNGESHRDHVERFIHYTGLYGPTKFAIGPTQSSLHDFPLRGEAIRPVPCEPRVPIMVATYLSILTYCNIELHRLDRFIGTHTPADSIFSFWSCNSNLSEIECQCHSMRSRLNAIDVRI